MITGAGQTRQQPVNAPDVPAVEAAVKEMHHALEALSTALSEVGVRTQRLCKPDAPVSVGSAGGNQIAPAEPIRSPLADEIIGQVRLVRDFTARVRYTLDRLEV